MKLQPTEIARKFAPRKLMPDKASVKFDNTAANQSKLFSLANYLPYQLAIISSRLSRALELAYGVQHGLARAEWRTLALICELECCVSSDLVVRAGLDAVAIHRAVKRLQALGYVIRQSDKSDKRKRWLSVTLSGRAVFDQVVPHAIELEQTMFRHLSATESRVLRQALKKLAEANFHARGLNQ